MSKATDKLNEWAASNRTQADLIRYLARVGADDVRAVLSEAQADMLEATADGWEEISQAISDQVDDPDQH